MLIQATRAKLDTPIVELFGQTEEVRLTNLLETRGFLRVKDLIDVEDREILAIPNLNIILFAIGITFLG